MQPEIIDARYRILRPLGRSRSSSVFLAEDLLEGGHEVALKTITAERDGGPAFGRLRDEFRALRGLRHPNVARILSLGRDAETERPYLAMEYVPGRTLLQILHEDGLLAPEAAISVLVQLCRGLSFVHGRGIVHNDVKPSNVMFSDGVVRLLDFGLADQGSAARRQAKGTLAYLAPESITGRVDARSDLFAVGVTFVELLTGRPFHGEADANQVLRNLTFEDAFERVRNDALDAVPHKVLRRVAERLTAFAPDRRPRSATHVLLDLKAELDPSIELETEDTRRAYLHGTRLVGRDGIAESLIRALDDPETCTSVLTVSGPEGMGKTRVLSELAWDRQELGWRVLRASAPAGHSAPFQGAAELVSAALMNASEGLVAAHCRELVKVVPQHPRLEGVEAAPRLDARTERGVLIHQIGAFLTAFAADQERPVLISVSGAGRLDSATLDVLAEMVFLRSEVPDRGGRAHVLVGLDDHPGRAVAHWMESLRAKGRLAETRLPPLDAPGVEAFLEAVFGADALDASLREAVPDLHAYAGGTPVVLEETVRALLEDGVIQRGQHGFALGRSLGEVDLPSDPAGLVSRVLEGARLTEQDRATLECLALVRRPVAAAELSHLLADDEDATVASLHRLEHQDLVVVDHEPSGQRHRIAAGLLRDAVARGVERREASHLAIAQRMETYHGDAAAGIAEELARHFDHGREPGRARHWYAVAARQSSQRFENRRTLSLLERLIDLTPPDDSAARLEILLMLADAHEALSQWDDGVAAATAARALADTAGDDAGRARALFVLGSLERNKGDLLHARELFLEAQDLFTALEDQVGLARALGARGSVDFLLGHYDECEECHERELGIAAGLGDETLIARAMGQLGNLHLAQDRLNDALACYQRQKEIAERTGDERTLGIALGNMGIVYRRLGQYEKSEEAYLGKRDVSRRIGDRQGLAIAYGNLAVVHWYRGEYGRSLECARFHLTVAEELGDLRSIASASGNLGDLLDVLGNPVEAEAAYDRAIGLCEKLGLRAYYAFYASRKARMLLRQERRGEARFHAEQALRAADDVDDHESRASARVTLATVRHMEAVSHEARQRVADEVRDWLADAESDEARAAFHRLLFQLAGDRRDAVAAIELYRVLESSSPRAEYREAITALTEHIPEKSIASSDETQAIDTTEHTIGNPSSSSEDPLRDLVEIGRRLTDDSTSSNLLTEIVDLTVRVTRADRGFLLVPVPGGEMNVKIGRSRGGVDLPAERLGVSRRVLRRVTARRESVVVPDLLEDSLLAEESAETADHTRSVLCFPLFQPRVLEAAGGGANECAGADQALIGVLYVDSRAIADTGRLESGILEFAEALAGHAAVGLANARRQAHMEDLVTQKTHVLEDRMRSLERSAQQLAAEVERHKEMERGLRRAVEDARKSHAESAAFLAQVLRALRVPLAAAAESTAGPTAPGSRRPSDEARRLLDLVDAIEDVAHMESGRRAVRRVKTDLTPLLASFDADLARATGFSGRVAHIERSARLPRRIDVDAARLRRILMELVHRALRVGPATAVRVAADAQAESDGLVTLRLSVSDAGPSSGKLPLTGTLDDLSPMSEPAMSADELGLSVARRIAERAGMRLDVRRGDGPGSTIAVVLDLGPASGIDWQPLEGEATAETMTIGQLPELHGVSVLIVDESRLVQRTIGSLLRGAGAETVVADNGSGGLEAARARAALDTPFDVVLFDLDLPDLDGQAVLHELRRTGGPSVVVGLQARGRPSGVVRLAGLDALLEKPVKPETLIDTCLYALARANELGPCDEVL